VSLAAIIVRVILAIPQLAKFIHEIRIEMDRQARQRAYIGNQRDIDNWLLDNTDTK
jgi:heme exporter protein D